MANISAQILRELVSSVFGIKGTDVRLSGEIKPNQTWQNIFHNGSCGSNQNEFTIFGFSPKDGFEDISYIVGSKESSNYAHSDSIDIDGDPLHTIEKDYIFFLVKEEGYSRWAGSLQEEWVNYTIYKAPDFKSYRTKIEQEDIDRWEKWLNS